MEVLAFEAEATAVRLLVRFVVQVLLPQRGEDDSLMQCVASFKATYLSVSSTH